MRNSHNAFVEYEHDAIVLTMAIRGEMPSSRRPLSMSPRDIRALVRIGHTPRATARIWLQARPQIPSTFPRFGVIALVYLAVEHTTGALSQNLCRTFRSRN